MVQRAADAVHGSHQSTASRTAAAAVVATGRSDGGGAAVANGASNGERACSASSRRSSDRSSGAPDDDGGGDGDGTAVALVPVALAAGAVVIIIGVGAADAVDERAAEPRPPPLHQRPSPSPHRPRASSRSSPVSVWTGQSDAADAAARRIVAPAVPPSSPGRGRPRDGDRPRGRCGERCGWWWQRSSDRTPRRAATVGAGSRAGAVGGSGRDGPGGSRSRSTLHRLPSPAAQAASVGAISTSCALPFNRHGRWGSAASDLRRRQRGRVPPIVRGHGTDRPPPRPPHPAPEQRPPASSIGWCPPVPSTAAIGRGTTGAAAGRCAGGAAVPCSVVLLRHTTPVDGGAARVAAGPIIARLARAVRGALDDARDDEQGA